MADLETSDQEEGMKAVVREYCRDEMAMPEEAIEVLEIKKVFRPPGNTESDKLFVELEEEYMVRSFSDRRDGVPAVTVNRISLTIYLCLSA